MFDENWMVGWLCAELQAKEGNVSLVFGGRCGEERMDGPADRCNAGRLTGR